MQLNALDNEFIFNLVIEIRDEIEGKDTFVRVKRLNVVFFKVLATITYARPWHSTRVTLYLCPTPMRMICK